MAAMRTVEVEAGPAIGAARPDAGERPGALEVLGDARRVAADAVDVRRGQLDQALEERPLGEVVRAHPGRLEQLVGLEEVAPLVRGEAAASTARRRASAGAAGRPSPDRPAPTSTTRRRARAITSARSSGRRPPNPVSSSCQ